MTTDPYAWFSPHEERENRERAESQLRWARQQIDHARTEGQESVLQVIVDREKSAFWETMRGALDYLATCVAKEVVFPRMRDNYGEAVAQQRRMETEFRALSMQILTPMMTAPSPIGIRAMMSPIDREGAVSPRVVFQMPAFSFTQQLPPLRDFR